MVFSKRGQNTGEYVIMAGIVIMAFVVMQTYVKRGIQGTVKTAADQMGAQLDSEDDSDYGQITSSSSTVAGNGSYTTSTSAGGSQAKSLSSSSVTNTTSTNIQYAD